MSVEAMQATGPNSQKASSGKRLTARRLLRPWFQRKPVQILLDAFCGSLAIMLSYGLRFDMQLPNWAHHQMAVWAGTLFVLNPVAIVMFRGGRSSWRYFGLGDFRALTQRLLLLHAALLMLSLAIGGTRFMPFSIVIMDLLLVLLLSGSVRLLQRMDHEALLRVSANHRILVAGTLETVPAAIRQLQPLYGTGICGVLIEGETNFHHSVLGVPVLGNTKSLGTCIRSQGVNLLFLCSADLVDMGSMIEDAARFDIAVKFLPSVHDLLNNSVRVSKPVTVASLHKGLEESPEQSAIVIESLKDKVVLVTGAGGSIGSELVRQVAAVPVRKLILLDQDENAVFELLGELGARADLMPVIADIRDREALRSLFAREAPHVVLHAAAYKHVPMMEANPCEAVLNNVYGTRMLAETALAYGAERMVMISSDKAVRPSSVMGATKRTAEVVIQEIARSAMDDPAAKTEFACVRFGNVLGSRGSVLPIFLKQIEQGGPLTVTHEEMTRYFMTIPQAVSLVLKASTLGSQGHIYMLDMGDPVLIMNFAREVIRMSGLTPGKDIEIVITGSRPGEKLAEQLWNEDARVDPTQLKHIFRVHAGESDPTFAEHLTRLEQAAHEHRSEQIKDLLRQMPIDYLTQRNVQEPALAKAS